MNIEGKRILVCHWNTVIGHLRSSEDECEAEMSTAPTRKSKEGSGCLALSCELIKSGEIKHMIAVSTRETIPS
jgi:hypothetical protein